MVGLVAKSAVLQTSFGWTSFRRSNTCSTYQILRDPDSRKRQPSLSPFLLRSMSILPRVQITNIYKTLSDVDECLLDTNRCHSTQLCSNTEGGYRCSCPPGYLSLGAGQRCLGKSDINVLFFFLLSFIFLFLVKVDVESGVRVKTIQYTSDFS